MVNMGKISKDKKLLKPIFILLVIILVFILIFSLPKILESGRVIENLAYDQTCGDETPYGLCSKTEPYFCANGVFV